MSEWQRQKEEVLKTARQMFADGLVVGTSGNVSMRLPKHDGLDILAITPHHMYYDEMTPDDIVVMDFEGETIEGNVPSVEAMLHIGIYKARYKVKAVVHTHSIYASALAVAGEALPSLVDEQVTFIGDGVRVAKYAISASDELAAYAVDALGERNAVILANHGLVGVGRSLREALTVCQMVERLSQIFVLAQSLGGVNRLPSDVVCAEQAFFNMLQAGEDE